MNNKRGRRSNRSGRDRAEQLRDIHSKVRGVYRAVPNPNAATAVVLNTAALRHGCAEIDETVQDHIVPRKSLTIKQLLSLKPLERERITLKSRQWDHKLQRMIETTDDYFITPRGTQSLLIHAKTGQQIGTYKRDGYVRNGLHTQRYRRTEKEIPASDMDTVLGPAGDRAPFDADDLED
jgi:hypothetical protein